MPYTYMKKNTTTPEIVHLLRSVQKTAYSSCHTNLVALHCAAFNGALRIALLLDAMRQIVSSVWMLLPANEQSLRDEQARRVRVGKEELFHTKSYLALCFHTFS